MDLVRRRMTLRPGTTKQQYGGGASFLSRLILRSNWGRREGRIVSSPERVQHGRDWHTTVFSRT
jgi:hypothetical protein